MGKSGAERRSVRLNGYDYSRPGAYFLTIVSDKRRCLFGKVVNQDVALSGAGRMIKDSWEALPRRFPTVELGAYVVMPNHLHGIIILHDPVGATFTVARAGVNPAPTNTPRGPTLGAVVGAFKSLTARQYRSASAVSSSTMPAAAPAADPPPSGRLWQRGYYDHVIRSESDWAKIHLYIEANPAAWDKDEDNPAPSRLSAG